MQAAGALQPIAQRMRAWEWAALLVILAVAGFLRLQQPDFVEYRRDEANLSRLALSMARGESVPLLGVGSSIGVPNPPFSVWVFAPAYAVFGNDPIRVTQYVGVLGVLAVLLLFLFARRWFGPAAAITAAALFATAPWAVIWSRKIWAQDVIPCFVLLTLGTGVLGFLERKRWAQALFLPLLSITGQIYYATFVLVPVAAYLIWAGRRHLGRAFWVGVGVTVLSVVPFLVGALQAWNELPPGVAEAHLGQQAAERDIALSDQVLLRLRDTWGGSGARDFVGGEVSDFVLDGAPDGEIFYEILGVLALIACGWLLCRALTPGASPLDRTLALWALVTPLVYAFTWTTVWIHYMIPVLPLGFLALGVWLRDLSRGALFRVGGAKPWIAVGCVLLVALSAVQTWSQTSILGFVGTYHTPGGFGLPLGVRLKVRDDVLSREPRRVVLSGAGDDVVEDGEAAIWDVLLSGAKDVTVITGETRVFPREPAILLHGTQAFLSQDVTVHTLRPAVPPLQGTVLSSEGVIPVGVVASRAPTLEHQVAVDVPGFACGLRPEAFAWDEARDELTLVWRVGGAQAGIVHVQARLLDAQGKQVALLEERLPRGSMWRSGDAFVWKAHPAWEEPAMQINTLEPLPASVLDPRAIEIRLFTEVKRVGLQARQWISLRDDPNTKHLRLELR